MNTITMVVATLTLWLVMGLGFLSAYMETRRAGQPARTAWMSVEGWLFMVSLALPAMILFYRAAFR